MWFLGQLRSAVLVGSESTALAGTAELGVQGSQGSMVVAVKEEVAAEERERVTVRQAPAVLAAQAAQVLMVLLFWSTSSEPIYQKAFYCFWFLDMSRWRHSSFFDHA